MDYSIKRMSNGRIAANHEQLWTAASKGASNEMIADNREQLLTAASKMSNERVAVIKIIKDGQ